MIIKLFGPSKGDEEKDINEIKIEFINLVEPLVAIVKRSQDHGKKMTSLAIMAIVNMCNFTADIKDIFMQKGGF